MDTSGVPVVDNYVYCCPSLMETKIFNLILLEKWPEIPGVNWERSETFRSDQEKSFGNSMGLVFWPRNFHGIHRMQSLALREELKLKSDLRAAFFTARGTKTQKGGSSSKEGLAMFKHTQLRVTRCQINKVN